MGARDYWQLQLDNPALDPEVLADSGHRGDIATYVHYAGALPGFPLGQPFSDWDERGVAPGACSPSGKRSIATPANG
jgi:hypothetical protein